MIATTWFWHHKFSLLLLVGTVCVTVWAIHAFHKPGQIDVVTAQAMDMSAMRPPAGAMPVTVARVTRSAQGTSVDYTGTLAAYNVQDIAPRVTGVVSSLPVYPGQTVRAGEVVARIDAQETDARAEAAVADAQKAMTGARTASAMALQAQTSLAESSARVPAAQAALDGAKADADALSAAVPDAQAGVTSAKASVDYWTAEIAREKKLTDAGAASRQEYQSELAQSQAAQAALDQAAAKLSVARAQARSAQDKVREMAQELDAARLARAAAASGAVVARSQAMGEENGVASARASAREADVLAGYTEVHAQANGIVTERPVAPGSLVQAGTVLARIAQIDRLRVQANVAVDDLTEIGVGSRVTIIFADGKSSASRVTSVFPSADAETHTAVVEALLENPNHRYYPGAFVTMRLTKPGTGDRLRVPASSLVQEDEATVVWLAHSQAPIGTATRYRCAICGMTYSAADARRNGYKDPMDGGELVPVAVSVSDTGGAHWTAHRVPVTVVSQDGATALLASPGAGGRGLGALREGDTVITSGQTGLMEGMAVLPPRADPPLSQEPTPQPPPEAGRGTLTPFRFGRAGAGSWDKGGSRKYRCEKCGMIYSAADAKKNHYVDPMDGGRLDPVK